MLNIINLCELFPKNKPQIWALTTNIDIFTKDALLSDAIDLFKIFADETKIKQQILSNKWFSIKKFSDDNIKSLTKAFPTDKNLIYKLTLINSKPKSNAIKHGYSTAIIEKLELSNWKTQTAKIYQEYLSSYYKYSIKKFYLYTIYDDNGNFIENIISHIKPINKCEIIKIDSITKLRFEDNLFSLFKQGKFLSGDNNAQNKNHHISSTMFKFT